MLLDLIRGQQRVTAFDEAVQAVSTQLNELAARARAGEWEKGDALVGSVQQGWVGVYAKYYLNRPSDYGAEATWQTTFDAVSLELGQLEKLYAGRDFEKLHPVVRGVQDRLIRFYRARTPETPSLAFERAKSLALRLADQAQGPRSEKRDLGEIYLHLEDQIGRLPAVPGSTRERMLAAVRRLGEALGTPADAVLAARELVSTLEPYRQQALEKLWFSPATPESKGGSK
ncbi:MAG: hypothetical protein HY816_06015 [Candidatus Wallbacteria bacterium]|nr:hypothetical protein [Candidatus Wallbacteria bacterium]